ncbi:MAG: exodeoxyribonuclease III [Saprospiraceae bacterium]|nr:exodeoxyribonuclease III [Saprospiraceae bacterium]
MKIISWNVNGLRANIGKEFHSHIESLSPDVVCLQETKAQDDQVAQALSPMTGWHIYSNSAEKKGYSGVAILSKTEPLSVSRDIGIAEHDTEGRVITAEYQNFFLVNVYVPNSGEGLKRLSYRSDWDKAFAGYLSKLKKKKPIIVTGDFNVAHKAIDLARPKENYNKTSGYTQTEIDGMDGLLNVGLLDAYRHLYPEKVQYTFWSVRFGARAKNVGWRIDYFLVDSKLEKSLAASQIHDQLMGSDHCPIELTLND